MPYMEFPDGLVIETRQPSLHPEAKPLSIAEGKRKRRAYAIAELRKLLRPGDTVYTILRHVSASGMSRRISCVILATDSNGKPYPRSIDSYVADAVGLRLSDKRGMIVGGCGMDMGFSVVYDLSRTLFRDAFDCIGERCPSNDHSNGDRDRTPHRHSDGGYALRHSWL